MRLGNLRLWGAADPAKLYDHMKNSMNWNDLGTMFRAGAYHYYNGTQLISIDM